MQLGGEGEDFMEAEGRSNAESRARSDHGGTETRQRRLERGRTGIYIWAGGMFGGN